MTREDNIAKQVDFIKLHIGAKKMKSGRFVGRDDDEHNSAGFVKTSYKFAVLADYFLYDSRAN